MTLVKFVIAIKVTILTVFWRCLEFQTLNFKTILCKVKHMIFYYKITHCINEKKACFVMLCYKQADCIMVDTLLTLHIKLRLQANFSDKKRNFPGNYLY